MKVMLVEPFGHREGHFSGYPNYLSRALADAGSYVTLITFDGVLGNWTDKDTRIRHLYVLAEAGFLAPVWRLLRGFLHFILPLRPLTLVLEAVLAFRLAFRQNKKHEYDVIHLLDTSTQSLLFLTFASMAKNLNLVCTRHGPSKEQDLKDWRTKFKVAVKNWDYLLGFYLLSLKVSESRFMRIVGRFLYHRAIKRNRIAFICVSEETRQTYAHSVFYDKIVYIPDARPKPPVLSQQEARQHLRLPPNEKTLLCFGINHTMKDYEVIFQAAHNLPKDFRLLFAGKILPECARQNDPRRFAEKYGLAEKTTIVDEHISDEEMPYYFCATDVLILSYKNVPVDVPGSFSYGYLCGLPAITVNTGRMGELVKSYNLGLTFTPEDPDSLRQAILTFLSLSDEERQAMRNRVSEFASSSHSWEQMTKGYLDLYQSLLEKTK